MTLKNLLQSSAHAFSPVVPFSPAVDKLVKLDFTNANQELDEEVVGDTVRFTDFINNKLSSAGARFGIGGYDEHRTVYSRSKLFGSAETALSDEPRRLHLGMDVWGRPYTPVMAPMDAVVHSFAFNNAFGDYGATIILTHWLEGAAFYTLFGHLSLNSIKNLYEGERISKGDIIGEFGIPAENGQWPPHLHFQLIEDLQGWKGDYPGVCKFSERQAWLSNCPDPDLILQMNQYLV